MGFKKKSLKYFGNYSLIGDREIRMPISIREREKKWA